MIRAVRTRAPADPQDAVRYRGLTAGWSVTPALEERLRDQLDEALPSGLI